MTKGIRRVLIGSLLSISLFGAIQSNATAQTRTVEYWPGYWRWYDQTYRPYYHRYYGPTVYQPAPSRIITMAAITRPITLPPRRTTRPGSRSDGSGSDGGKAGGACGFRTPREFSRGVFHSYCLSAIRGTTKKPLERRPGSLP